MISETETLADFIRRRKGELDAQEQQSRAKLDAIAQERKQLSAAAAAAKVELEPASAEKPEEERNAAFRRAHLLKAARSRWTMKEAVVETLRQTGLGMTVGQLLEEVNRRLGSSYERTSLSPQLSRLKADGIVKRDGNVWSLAESGPKNTETGDDPGQDQQSPAPSRPTTNEPEDRAGGGT